MRVPTATLSSSIDGISTLALAAYLVAVVYQGNVKSLGAAVLADGPGFLEAVVSIYILALLVNVKGPIGDIMSALIVLALIVLIVKLMSGNGASAMKAFGSGQISLFELVKRLATQ